MRLIKNSLLGLLLLIILSACDSSSVFGPKTYIIARDPTWYPMDFMGKGDNVLAFSDELLTQIAHIEDIEIEIGNATWEGVVFDLWKHEFDGILSTLDPTDANEAMYDFSNPYLYIGEVLVVRCNSDILSLKDMNNKIIGVRSNSLSLLTIEQFPGIVTRSYNNVAKAMEDLEYSRLDGVVLEILPAYTFVNSIYRDKLRVCTIPLTQQGLRLVTIKNTDPSLIEHFNDGLKKLKENGSYDLLLRKWGLHQ